MPGLLQGITPTLIQVRVAMGISFHDEKSMLEVTSSLRFSSNYPTSTAETVCVSIVYESRDDDIGILESKDSEKGWTIQYESSSTVQ